MIKIYKRIGMNFKKQSFFHIFKDDLTSKKFYFYYFKKRINPFWFLIKSWEKLGSWSKVNERELELSLYDEISEGLTSEIKVGYEFKNKKLKVKELFGIKDSIKVGISYDGNERKNFLSPYGKLKKGLLLTTFFRIFFFNLLHFIIV